MCIKKPSFLIFVLPLIILTALYMTIPDKPVYAKGVNKTGDSSDRASSNSDNRSSSDNQNSSENRSSDKPKSEPTERTSPPPSNNQTSEQNTEPDQGRTKGHDNTSSEPVTRSGDSSNQTSGQRSDSNQGQLKGHVNSVPVVRSESPSVNSNQREVNPGSQKGLYRKDYEDIGKIWQERQEHRSKTSDDSRDNNKTHSNSDTHINVNIFYPGKYNYYRYDYTPGYSYPSVYCFYYGYFPPYIQSHRVIYIYHNPGIHYTYIDLPPIIISEPWYRDDYYLRDGSNYQLSSALQGIRRAWERNDVDLLMQYVGRNSQVDIYLKDEYAYSVNKQDYYDMTRDAMSSVKTASFSFYRVRQRNSRESVAYGKHVYYDDFDSSDDFYYYYKQPNHKITVYVSYTLERNGNDWYITEVGCSPYKLD